MISEQRRWQRPWNRAASRSRDCCWTPVRDVNEGAEFRTALHGAGTRDMALLLLDAGADPLELGNEARRAIVGYPPEPDETLLNVSASEFEQGWSRRFGASKPERMEIPFWKGMILSGISAYEGKTLCAGESASAAGDGPVWCAQRYGQSLTFLPDGRIVQIAGEHEDSYDPDFCIYNDVFVHDGAGDVTIFGYPEAVFPPTDFHTATLSGEQIYLIGSLGYHGTRRSGFTPVYRLDTRTFPDGKTGHDGEEPRLDLQASRDADRHGRDPCHRRHGCRSRAWRRGSFREYDRIHSGTWAA